ncbi:hypothetical protein [Xanthomonas cucurbitae]|uniref:hypothetical protein n=1 Tax=Xanthomonas cucurbitae TaxID=56453 RepID=UPI001CB7981A|nr:hypothetical protein [Xanthomonas cucurbitae]
MRLFILFCRNRCSALKRIYRVPFFCFLVATIAACNPQGGALQEQADLPTTASPANSNVPASAPVSVRNHISPNPSEVKSLVKEVMNSAYGVGNFDPSRNCWKYELKVGEDSLDYCMIGVVSKVSTETDGAKIYVQSHSDPQAEIYSQVDPGIEGLFVVGSDVDKKIKVLAAKPATDMGQAGDCGCLNSKVIQVGPARYGWLSTAGGIWQGVQVTRYSLQVPVGSEIRDVSGIPRVSEKIS